MPWQHTLPVWDCTHALRSMQVNTTAASASTSAAAFPSAAALTWNVTSMRAEPRGPVCGRA